MISIEKIDISFQENDDIKSAYVNLNDESNIISKIHNLVPSESISAIISLYNIQFITALITRLAKYGIFLIDNSNMLSEQSDLTNFKLDFKSFSAESDDICKLIITEELLRLITTLSYFQNCTKQQIFACGNNGNRIIINRLRELPDQPENNVIYECVTSNGKLQDHLKTNYTASKDFVKESIQNMCYAISNKYDDVIVADINFTNNLITMITQSSSRIMTIDSEIISSIVILLANMDAREIFLNKICKPYVVKYNDISYQVKLKISNLYQGSYSSKSEYSYPAYKCSYSVCKLDTDGKCIEEIINENIENCKLFSTLDVSNEFINIKKHILNTIEQI